MKLGNKLKYVESVKNIIVDKHNEIDAIYEKMLNDLGIEKESEEADFLFDYIYNDFQSPRCNEILETLNTEF